ncbi:MAG: hypothetical protein N3G76_02320 [Candidatus Micrarchaeota archaeon]|nr:hypothetical protein [Candidatus Micrarchaeota archaeon]
MKLEGEHERNLTTAVTEAKRKFSRFAPLIDKLDKICRQENNAALGIVLAGELNYGMESEAAMEECLDNAKTIIDDWITLSNLAKGNSQD